MVWTILSQVVKVGGGVEAVGGWIYSYKTFHMVLGEISYYCNSSN